MIRCGCGRSFAKKELFVKHSSRLMETMCGPSAGDAKRYCLMRQPCGAWSSVGTTAGRHARTCIKCTRSDSRESAGCDVAIAKASADRLVADRDSAIANASADRLAVETVLAERDAVVLLVDQLATGKMAMETALAKSDADRLALETELAKRNELAKREANRRETMGLGINKAIQKLQDQFFLPMVKINPRCVHHLIFPSIRNDVFENIIATLDGRWLDYDNQDIFGMGPGADNAYPYFRTMMRNFHPDKCTTTDPAMAGLCGALFNASKGTNESYLVFMDGCVMVSGCDENPCSFEVHLPVDTLQEVAGIIEDLRQIFPLAD